MNYELFQHQYKFIKKKIFLVNMANELDFHFSQLALWWLKKYITWWKKVAILVNRKWYTNWVICHDCGHVPQCKKCSVSISFHKLQSWEKIWMCHICKTQYILPTSCPECNSTKIREYGMWTQRVAERIKQEFWIDSLLLDSDTTSSPKKTERLRELLSNFQVVIWTSLLNTPPKDTKFDLVIYLNADLWLQIPDYTVNEHNFRFLYEWFTKHQSTNFIVQTFNPDHYSIRSACRLDQEGFYKKENEFRQAHNYPPFGELCILLYKNELEDRVFNAVDKLYKELLFFQEKYWLKNDIEIYSTPPLVYKVFGKYRYNIILKWEQVRNFMDIVYSKLNLSRRWFKVDWMAESIV